jgi:hypothetical protein
VTAPSRLREGIFYVSIAHNVCLHRCFCGCRAEVVTPLGPEFWTITYDGETISMRPSIGSRTLACKSHYVVERGCVKWLAPIRGRAVARDLLDERQSRQSESHPGPSLAL